MKNYIGRNEIFKDIKFPFKFRDIHKRNSIGIKIFVYKNKKKYSIHVSIKCCEDKNIDLLMIGEVEKKHHILIKGFNTFTYDYILYRGRIFVVIVSKYMEHQMYWNVILKIDLKLMVNKGIRWLQRIHQIQKLWEKKKVLIYYLCRFWK